METRALIQDEQCSSMYNSISQNNEKSSTHSDSVDEMIKNETFQMKRHLTMWQCVGIIIGKFERVQQYMINNYVFYTIYFNAMSGKLNYDSLTLWYVLWRFKYLFN